MTDRGSITQWVGRLREGDAAAARELWDRYFPELVGLARRWLGGLARAAADEEDVALSAFARFCREAGDERFPRLDNRADLWSLLATLTIRKAIDLRRRSGARKRGGAAGLDAGGLDGVADPAPLPDIAAQVAEEVGRLLDRLGDPGLQAIALWKLEGQTNEEIAARLGCVPRTVERRLRVVRGLWGEGGADEPS